MYPRRFYPARFFAPVYWPQSQGEGGPPPSTGNQSWRNWSARKLGFLTPAYERRR